MAEARMHPQTSTPTPPSADPAQERAQLLRFFAWGYLTRGELVSLLASVPVPAADPVALHRPTRVA